MDNIKNFKQILKNSSLREISKKNIEFIIEYFQGKHNPSLSSRSFLFHGKPGIGKTYMAEKLLQTIDVEKLYMACGSFNFSNSKKYQCFEEIIDNINNNKKQIIFLDDLSYLIHTEHGEIDSLDRQLIMEILNIVKQNPNKLLLITVNDFIHLDGRMVDRIEVNIYFDLPSIENKKCYLEKNYKKYLTKKQINYVSSNTVGYNFRDLPEMIKLAYRIGKNHIDMNVLKQAIRAYRPTELYGYDVQNSVEKTLHDVIGKKKALNVVKQTINSYKNKKISENLGLRRNNLLLFHGPPGSGKSFMARALAGEIGFPLIRIHAYHIFSHDPFSAVSMITDMAKRYQNCVIFIDEAEKFFGNNRFGEDNPVLGEFHHCIDGSDDDEIKSIFVMAVNDLSRFGRTLRDRFILVPFKLPSFQERVLFFQEKKKHAEKHFKIKSSSVELADNTNNMSYRELDRFWNDFVFYSLENQDGKNEDIPSKLPRKIGVSENYGFMYS